MRRLARVDNSQSEIVFDLTCMGFTVLHTHQLGNGAPDFVAGRGGIDILVEVKNGPKDTLTPAELKFHQQWHGAPVLIAWSAEMVLAEWQRRGAKG